MSTDHSNKIGVATATIVGMNAMIGAGIFATPSVLATNVGPAAIISYAFVALSVWFMAQSFARTAQLFPQEGSFYTYAKQWGGHKIGLIASGSYLIGLLIAMGLLSQAAGAHLVRYIPYISSHHLGLIILWTLVILNMLGVTLSSLGQQLLIIFTVFPLCTTTFMCLSKADPSNLTPFTPYGIKSIFQATRFVAFAFFGFESSASLFNVIRDPEKNLPKALTYSLIAVAGLYLAFIASLILAVPLKLFYQFPGPVVVPLSYVFPHSPWVLECIHISSISAILGTLHSMIWSSSALFVSFVKRLKSRVAQMSLAFNILNPHTSPFVIGFFIFLSSIFLHNEMFINFTAFFLLIAFILSLITLLFIKQEWKSGQNYRTIVGLLTATIIFYFATKGILTHF